MYQVLVTQVTGMKEEGSEDDLNGENFRTAVDFVAKNLEARTLNKGAAGVDMGVMDKQFRGYVMVWTLLLTGFDALARHAQKARINSRDVLSEALETSYQRLKTHVAERPNDLDQEIKVSAPSLPPAWSQVLCRNLVSQTIFNS